MLLSVVGRVGPSGPATRQCTTAAPEMIGPMGGMSSDAHTRVSLRQARDVGGQAFMCSSTRRQSPTRPSMKPIIHGDTWVRTLGKDAWQFGTQKATPGATQSWVPTGGHESD